MARNRRTRLAMLLLGVGLALATVADTAHGEPVQQVPAPGSSRREITVSDYSVGWRLRCAEYLPGCSTTYSPEMAGVAPVGFVHTGSTAHLYQGQVTFNLGALKHQHVVTIRQATFHYREFIRHRDGMDEPSCVRDLNLLKSNQREDQLYDYYGNAYGRLAGGGWLVTNAVDGWFSGRTENQGFVLRGFDESANADSNPWGCLAHLTDFELRVVAEVDDPLANVGNETLEGARNRPGGLELQSPVGSLDPTRRAGSVAGQPGGPPEVEGRAGASTTVQVDETTTSAAQTTTPEGGMASKPTGQENSAATKPTGAGGGEDTKPLQPADLVVSNLQVRGKGVTAGSECRPGENRVLVTVRNAGAQPAAAFAVRLRVDGDDVDDEREVAGLEAGKEATVTFERVRARSGEREFRATADAERKVAEGDEGNNSREMKARCRDAEDADEEKKKKEDDKKKEQKKEEDDD